MGQRHHQLFDFLSDGVFFAYYEYVRRRRTPVVSGDYLVVDGFVVIPDQMAPVHDVTFRGITFAHTT